MIAGIDFSTNAIDVVRIPDEPDTGHGTWDRVRLAEPPLVDALGRARRVRDLMPARGAWRDAGIVMVAIEKPMTRSFTSCATLMRIQGAILACLPTDVAVLELAPTEWKRETVGKAMADKDAVRAWALEQLGDQGQTHGWPEDAFDAYAIAHAARTICDRAAQTTSPRRAA